MMEKSVATVEQRKQEFSIECSHTSGSRFGPFTAQAWGCDVSYCV